MNADSGVNLATLKVDGGMVANETLMQFQADIFGVPVVRPVIAETTALEPHTPPTPRRRILEISGRHPPQLAGDKRSEPQMDAARREKLYPRWRKAVTKTLD